MREPSLQGKLRVRAERGIYKRQTTRRTDDGRRETRYEVTYVDSDGRQRWRTVGTLKAARHLRASLVARVNSGERVAPANVTFGAFADTWLAKQEARLRPTTSSLYATYLRLHLKPRWGTRRVQSITVDDVAALIGEMQKGVRFVERDGRVVRETGKPFAAWTIRGVLVVVGRVFSSATRDGVVNANPVRKLEKEERPHVERRQFPDLDLATIGRLIEKTPARYRTLVALSLLTGLRQSEALGLRWQDVDVKGGVLRVRWQLDRKGVLVEPKTKAAKREVPIPPSLGRTLAAHRLASRYSAEADFLFVSEAGGPMHHRNIVRRGLEKATEGAGGPHLTWHDLRHVAASALVAQGGERRLPVARAGPRESGDHAEHVRARVREGGARRPDA